MNGWFPLKSLPITRVSPIHRLPIIDGYFFHSGICNGTTLDTVSFLPSCYVPQCSIHHAHELMLNVPNSAGRSPQLVDLLTTSVRRSLQLTDADARRSPQHTYARRSPQPIDAHRSPQPVDARRAPQPIDVRISPQRTDACRSPQRTDARKSPQLADARISPQRTEPVPVRRLINTTNGTLLLPPLIYCGLPCAVRSAIDLC